MTFVYFAATAGFFALCYAFVGFCDSLREG